MGSSEQEVNYLWEVDVSQRKKSSATSGASISQERTPERALGRITSPKSQAQRGAMLAPIREGTPLQVEELLSQLEASGDIGPYEDIINDEVAADEAMLEMDADMDLSDEDEPIAEDWGDEGAVLSDGDVDAVPSTNPFAPRRFEIVVTNGICSVPVDEKCIRSARTPLGQQVLYELESRIWALRRIAAWLTERRGEFLRTRDFWLLGCEALADISNKQVPVVQKSFLRVTGLEPRVSEASLSRYIRATDIAWTDGSAPLDILFSDDAKRVWVANAVRQFVKETGESVSTEMLDEYASIPVNRSADWRRRLAQMTPEALDLPTFIEKANMLAGTRWQDVVSYYRDRILG